MLQEDTEHREDFVDSASVALSSSFMFRQNATKVLIPWAHLSQVKSSIAWNFFEQISLHGARKS